MRRKTFSTHLVSRLPKAHTPVAPKVPGTSGVFTTISVEAGFLTAPVVPTELIWNDPLRGGLFIYNPAGVAANADGVTTYASATGALWERIYFREMNARWAGATTTASVTDRTVALQIAINVAAAAKKPLLIEDLLLVNDNFNLVTDTHLILGRGGGIKADPTYVAQDFSGSGTAAAPYLRAALLETSAGSLVIEGEGVLHGGDNYECPIGIDIKPSTTIDEVSISDIDLRNFSYIVRDEDANPVPDTYVGYGIRINPATGIISKVRLKHLDAYDCWKGYQVKEATGSSDISLYGCNAWAETFAGNGNRSIDGIDLDRNRPERILIQGGIFTTAIWGIQIASCKNVTVQGIICANQNGLQDIISQRGQGIHLEATVGFGDLENITIDGFQVHGARLHGVRILTGDGVTCKNVKLLHGQISAVTEGPGVQVSKKNVGNPEMSNIQIVDVDVIGDAGVSGDGGAGIILADVNGYSIHKCYVADCFGTGIGAAGRNGIVSKNIAKDNNYENVTAQPNFSVAGTAENVQVDGNYAYYEDRTTGFRTNYLINNGAAGIGLRSTGGPAGTQIENELNVDWIDYLNTAAPNHKQRDYNTQYNKEVSGALTANLFKHGAAGASQGLGWAGNASPEGVVTASRGHIVSESTGNVYVKETGDATNTGWQRLITEGDGIASLPSNMTWANDGGDWVFYIGGVEKFRIEA